MPSPLTLATLSDLRRLEYAWLAAPSAQTRTAYLSAAMARLPALLDSAEALERIRAIDRVIDDADSDLAEYSRDVCAELDRAGDERGAKP